jgi:hypothetical protein
MSRNPLSTLLWECYLKFMGTPFWFLLPAKNKLSLFRVQEPHGTVPFWADLVVHYVVLEQRSRYTGLTRSYSRQAQLISNQNLLSLVSGSSS